MPTTTAPTPARTRPARRSWPAFVLAATVAVALTACSSTAIKDRAATPTTVGASATTAHASSDPTPGDIVATAVTGGVFTELAGLVVDAGLVDTLRGPGPFTVFAPTDAAFAKVPTAVLHAIQADPERLKAVLTYHVVAGRLTMADLKPGTIKTVSGADLTVTTDGGITFVNGNPVGKGDIVATNGLIHVMGDVLVPPVGAS